MTGNRRDFLRGALAGGMALGGCAPGGPPVCRITDSATGAPVPARIRLTDSAGREVVPIGHPEMLDKDAQQGDVRFQSHRYAYVDGEFEVPADRLPLHYRVVKGYEHVIAEGEITGPADIPLSRWSTLTERNWYGGDIHIHHIAPQTCRLEMEAEDLHVANLLTSDFTVDQAEFEGRLSGVSSGNHLLYVNQEFRNHELGHLCLINLKKLIEPVKTVQEHHHPLHLRVCDETRAQGGYVSWAHFPSWPGVENPLDVAMDKLDGLEILCVLEPRDFPRFMKQVVPESEANDGLRLWYRYLNCGFPLTATAGTDKMTTFVTVGANRVYGRLDGEFTYENWIRALKAGRTFITNSPVLEFTVDQQDPGARIALDGSNRKVVQVHAKADSQLPYHRLEIVVNGQVVTDATPSGPRHSAEINLEYTVGESCWIAARALEDISGYRSAKFDFGKVHIEKGTLLSDYFGTRRPETVFAHSSPVYIELDNKPIRSWDDAQYYLRYMDNSMKWLQTEAKFARPSDKKDTLEAFRVGRKIYERRAAEARAST